MKELRNTIKRRSHRAGRVRAKLHTAPGRPRLAVQRSAKKIYAQIIDHRGEVLASAQSPSANKGKIALAKQVGEAIAKLAREKNITQVVLDRKYYKYHGRVRALAEAAREGGLKF
ncbi:MAG: 50S ribosomal protein L18 [bacterium]